jgi:hypothetical protein
MCNMGSVTQLRDWGFICCHDVRSQGNFSFVFMKSEGESVLYLRRCEDAAYNYNQGDLGLL